MEIIELRFTNQNTLDKLILYGLKIKQYPVIVLPDVPGKDVLDLLFLHQIMIRCKTKINQNIVFNLFEYF